MDFNNNPLLYPKERGLNPLTPIVERLSTLEGVVKNYSDSFETKELKVESLKEEEPILSNAIVGYDNDGKLIPIRIVTTPTESSLYFDYTVDSQQKFDDLMTILKSGTPNTYRSIAILGGLGDGDNGEYLYTINLNNGEADFNNASFIGFNNPKIVITANNAITLKVFKNGSIKDVEFDVGGTVVATQTVTLLYNCVYDGGKIGLNETSADFDIVNTTLSKVVNDECKSFSGCTLNDCTNNAETTFTSCNLNKGFVTDSCIFTSCELNDYTIDGNGVFTSCNLNNILINYACTFTSSTLKYCTNTKYSTFIESSLNFCDTVQSVFNKCNSEMLYVRTDSDIVNKYSFNKCGIHLDMKKSDMKQTETVTIGISSIIESKLTVLDASSNLKKIILNVDSSDSLSEIIGNNDKKYSIYKSFVERVSKSVSPSMISKAYLNLHDKSHTPIFSNDKIHFYIDEAMTKEVVWFNITGSDNDCGYAFKDDTTTLYSSLTFNEVVSYTNKSAENVDVIKLSDFIADFADEIILNGTPLKTYIIAGEESGTLLYSNDNGNTLYISSDIKEKNKVTYANSNNENNDIMYIINKDYIDGSAYYTKLLSYVKYVPFESYTVLTPKLLEVTALKDNYEVQVVSDYDVPIYVENAFNTKVKND